MFVKCWLSNIDYNFGAGFMAEDNRSYVIFYKIELDKTTTRGLCKYLYFVYDF